MKISNKMWMFFNKKPPTKNISYFYVATGWIFCGMMWLMSLAGISASVETGERGAILATIVSFVFALLFSLFLYLADRKMGYTNAIYKHNLQRWEERTQRILEQRQNTETKQEVQ